METVSPVEAVTPELVGPVPTTAEPEVARIETEPSSMSAAVSASIEAVSPPVREFETVSGSRVESQPPVAAEPEPEPVPVQAVEPVAPPEPEAQQVEAEAKSEDEGEASPVAEPPHHEEPTAFESAQPAMPAPVQEERHEERLEEQKEEEPKAEEPAPVVAVATSAAEEVSPTSEEQPESAAPAFVSEASLEQTPASQISSDTPESVPTAEPVAGGTRDTGKKESEIAETTAAAWASWRRIRESSDSKPSSAQSSKSNGEAEHETPSPQDTAAMAVAAGAEKAPEDTLAAPEDSGDIANIVDSVLAEMRPKIVAEISKKMGKKK
jgi:hypothetical protein